MLSSLCLKNLERAQRDNVAINTSHHYATQALSVSFKSDAVEGVCNGAVERCPGLDFLEVSANLVAARGELSAEL